MRRVYDEFFCVPKHGKIREKVMLARAAVTVFIMIVCLVAMSVTAYAYFSSDASLNVDTVKAADFDLNITVTDVSTGQIVTAGADGVYSLSGGSYTVVLKKEGTAETGFCIMKAGSPESVYHTAQIGVSGESEIQEISFTLTVTSEVSVSFTPHWGTSHYYGYSDNGDGRYILNNATVILA